MAFQVIQTLHKKFTKENDKSETPVSIFSTTRFTKWCALQACLLQWWWSCLHPIATLQCRKSTACTVVTSHSEEPPHGADIAFHTSSTMPCLLKNTRYLVPSEHRSISKAAIVHEQCFGILIDLVPMTSHADCNSWTSTQLALFQSLKGVCPENYRWHQQAHDRTLAYGIARVNIPLFLSISFWLLH